MGNSKKRGIATLAIIVSVTILCAVIGIVSDKYLGDDNLVEEESEQIIKNETGLDIDLTPKSKESTK